MKSNDLRGSFRLRLRKVFGAGLSLAFLAVIFFTNSTAAKAQTATISGTLSSFDVVNRSGQDAHGFEIQVEGAKVGDFYYQGFGQRYGIATLVPYATGVYIRWTSKYDAVTQQYASTTPQHIGAATFAWQDCYMGGAGYSTSGCEAMSQGLRYPVTPGLVATGHWLIEDTQNPGNLIAGSVAIDIPLIVNYSVAPSTVVAAAPVIIAVPEPPEPPPTPEVFGDAQWVKVYKTQLTSPVVPGDLDNLNSIIPSDPTQVEVAWDILQVSPPSNGNQKQTRNRTQGAIAADTRSIVRRFETYKYLGAYDLITHKVACADGTCTAPSTGELGDFIGATNSAANVVADALIVNRAGTGSVTGANGKIGCGTACSTFAAKGTVLSLIANPGGNVFLGWTGACTGNQLNCSVGVSGATQVGASFAPQFTLSIGRSNPGTVTGTPSGNDKALNCGGDCSAKFTQGTTVTLTAIPPAGKSFVSWGGSGAGACSQSASPTCNVTITGNASIQANFSK